MSSLIQISLGAASDSKWWELVPAALGAVLGAAAGAIPAFWLARRSSAETMKRDADQRRQQARDAATKAMIRLQRITNGIYTIHNQIEETLSEAEAGGLKGKPLWMQLKPIGAIAPEPVRFDLDEISVIFAAKRADLANQMMLLSERHFALETAMKEYGTRRTFMGDALQPEMNGSIGTSYLTAPQLKQFGHRAAELNDMAEHMRRTSKADFDSGVAAIRALSNAMQAHFDDPTFLKIAFGKVEMP